MTNYKASDSLLLSTGSGVEIELDLEIEYAVTPWQAQTSTCPEIPRMVEDVELTASLFGIPLTLSSRIEAIITENSCFKSWLLYEARDQDERDYIDAAEMRAEARREREWEDRVNAR
ncbi:hypothetical protein CN085_19590 [Sinorhizobium meliloti]|uniref:hypothetical protein n=1 Tax=Rhizobium meliloti TaxID=382 RepID=UPI000FD880C6|nr:hypothetical protein [Sinorhizobium meliloti]RVP13117.1 hypothetical protein CN085_19590 [Sinorhizobium meliloti]